MPDVNPTAFTSGRLNTYTRVEMKGQRNDIEWVREENTYTYREREREKTTQLYSQEMEFKKIKGPRDDDYYRKIYEVTVIEFLTSTCAH